jgi:hypothetical protein
VQGPLVSGRPTFYLWCRVKGRGERRDGILVVRLVAKGKIDISRAISSFLFLARVRVADGGAPPYDMLHRRLPARTSCPCPRAGV